ncbi:MAG TPA: hypothetical protein VIV63_15870 [Steroidobacteraceae bacterium]
MRVSRLDPFEERPRRTWRRRLTLLGAVVEFECDSPALRAVVDAAYAGIPAPRPRARAPRYFVRIRTATDSATFRGEPPQPRLTSGAGLLCASVDASNYTVVDPASRSALIVASPAMLAHPYYLRCEFVEFALFTLAARDQAVVALHAACVGHGNRGVLLLGQSGAGKSTATLQSMLSGLAVLSEDVVFVEPRRMRATGVPNFLHLRRESLRLLSRPLARRIRSAPLIRRRSGVIKHEFDLRQFEGAAALQPLQLVATVVLSRRRAKRGAPLLEKLLVEPLLRALDQDQPYARTRAHWHALRRGLGKIPAYQLLRGADPAQAGVELRRLLRGTRA